MKTNNLSHFLNKLDRVYSLLDAPNVSKSGCSLNPIWTFIKRIGNLIFGDHHWINNKKARKIVKYYLFKASTTEITPERSDVIKKIIERLALIKNGNKTFGSDLSGINPSDTNRFRKLNLQPIDNRMLFHIHANKFGAKSKLEGSNTHYALTYFYQFLKGRQSQNLPLYGIQNSEEMLYELEVAIRFEASNSTERNSIVQEAVKLRKPFLLPGGWAGQPGHAIYYEVVPQPDGKINLRVCNLGSGADHHSQVREGVKVKYSPDEEWKGIESSRLCEENVIQALSELITSSKFPNSDNRTEYNETDIYFNLKDLLKPTEIVKTNHHQHKSTQESGICSWKSLMAFASRRMTKENYKRMILDIKLQSLTDRVSDLKKDKRKFANQIVQFHLIQKSWQSVCRRLDRTFEKGIIDNQYYLSARHYLNKVGKWVSKNEHILIENTSSILSNKPKDALNPNLPSIFTADSSLDIKSSSQDQICTFVVEDLRAIEDFSKPQKLTEQLKQILDRSNRAWNNKEYHALHIGLTHLISKLPARIEQLNPIQGQMQAELLGDIAALYFKTCFLVPESTIIHSDRVYSMGRLLSLLEDLCSYAYKVGSSSLYGKSFNRKDLLLSVFDKRILLQNSERSVDRHVDFQKILDKNKYLFEHVLYLKKFLKESGVAAIERIDPEIRNKLAASDNKWSTYHEAGCAARIYTSSQLPKWLKAIRDTNYYLHYLRNGAVAKPVSFDPKNFLNISYTYKDSEVVYPKTEVEITLEGTSWLERQYSQVKEMIAQPSYRFYPMHRPIASNSFKKLLHSFFITHGFKEVNYLSKNVQEYPEIKMSDEEFKEITHLFHHDGDYPHDPLSISKTLEYFTKYSEKLLDPDFQVLFKILLFNFDHISSINDQEFVNKIEKFYTKQLNHFMSENNIQAAVFMLQIGRYFSSYFPNAEFKKCEDQLRILLERKEIELEERSLIWGELMAHHRAKEKLTERELVELLIGSCHRNDYPVPNKWKEPVTDRDARDVMLFHAKALEELLLQSAQPNQRVLNAIFRANCPGEGDQQWEVEKQKGHFATFLTKDGNYRYNPLNGQLVSLQKQIFFPLSIREHPHFITLFKKDAKAHLSKDGVYSFNHNGKAVRIFWKDDELIIEQELSPKTWYRFLSPFHFEYEKQNKETKQIEIKYPLRSRFLAQHYQHWQSLKTRTEILLLDPKTQQAVYAASCVVSSEITSTSFINDVETRTVLHESKIKTLRRLKDNSTLSDSSSLFARFENPAYIHEWHTALGALKEVELPRFGLTFSSSKLICNEISGYHLVPNCNLSCFGPYRNYLVLENDAGHRKVILPYQDFYGVLPPNQPESLLPLYNINRHLDLNETKPEVWFEYDLKENGHLVSDASHACLYLAYVLNTSQQYKSAAHYLKKYGIKPSDLNKIEQEILICMSNNVTGDESGDATALRLFALYLLMKSGNRTVQKKAHAEYSNYLQKLHTVTAIKLEPHEEIYLLKLFLASTHDEAMLKRLNEIDPKLAQRYEKPKETIKIERETNENKNTPLKKIANPLYHGKSEFNLDLALITRPLPYFIEHFHYFYNLAKNGTAEEKKWIGDSLSFIKFSTNNEARGYYHLFNALLTNPEKFPDYDHQNDNLYNIWTKITDLALTVEIQNKVEQPVHRTVHDVTSVHSEPIKPTIQPIVINYSAVTGLPSFNINAKKCFRVIEQKAAHKNALQKLWDWLASVRKGIDDPLMGEEIDRLKDRDMPEYQRQRNAKTLFGLERNGLKNIEKILQSNRKEQVARIKQLEESIRVLAAKEPEDILLKAKSQNRLEANTQKQLTIKKIMCAYARKMPELLQQENPALNDKDINELFRLMEEYLLLSTHEQHRTRCLEVYQQIKALNQKSGDNSKKIEPLVQELAEKMLAERQFKPSEFPEYLVLEKVGNILIRNDQIEKLKEFKESGDLNPIMEMIMGSGKSKVLLPLLGLMRADGKKVSTLIVPHALFGTNADDIYKVMQSYGVKVRALHFDRNSTFTKESLDTMLTDLKGIRDRKEILIMTSKSVQCLILKFIEKCEAHFDLDPSAAPKDYGPELKMLAEILSIIGQGSNPNFDEADTLLNVLHEVCFSLGKPRSPRQEDLVVESLLYELLFTNERLRGLARLECDASPAESALLTTKLYEEELKPAFAEEFLEALTTISYDSNELTQKVRDYALRLKNNKAEKALALSYLTHSKEKVEEHQKYFNSLDEDIQDVIALAAMQISAFMSHTLLRTYDENYGVDEEAVEMLAVPFAAAKTPNKGSQFANEHITINFTYQTYLKNSIPATIIEKVLQNLQRKVKEELAAGIDKKDSKAWKAFCELKGADYNMSLFKYSEKDVAFIQSKINANVKAKLKFVTTYILPHLKLFENKLSCNPLNLVAFFKILSGFTGTLWNGKSMHGKIDPRPALGTDSKTLSFLWENSLEAVHTIKEGTTLQMLQELQTKGVTYDVISDAGGYFKQGSNQEIAEAIQSFNKAPVVFFRKDKLDITQGKMAATAPKDRLTFLDQIHTVGSDVKQKRTAKAIVTISRNMLLRDLLQSVWRLRELDRSQRVIFVMTEDVKEIVRETFKLGKSDKITLREILLFTIHNQAKRQGLDNFKTLKQELWSIPQGILLEVLLNPNLSVEQHKQVYLELRKSWIRSAKIRPKDLFGQIVMERDCDKIVEAEKKECIDFLDSLFKKLPFLKDCTTYSDYKKLINDIAKRLEGYLHKKVMSPDPNVDTTMEQEKEAEKERENEMESQEQAFSSLVTLERTDGPMQEIEKMDGLKTLNTWILPVSHIMSKDKNLAGYAEAFADVSISMNALQWNHTQKHADLFKLLGQQRTPFHFLRVKQDKVWILSEDEALKMKNYKPESSSKIDLYNLTLGFLFKEEEPTPAALGKIVKAKFLNGEANYSEKEQDFLKKWLKESDPKKMRQLFVGQILAGFPNKKSRYYENSSLQTIFAELEA